MPLRSDNTVGDNLRNPFKDFQIPGMMDLSKVRKYKTFCNWLHRCNQKVGIFLAVLQLKLLSEQTERIVCLEASWAHAIETLKDRPCNQNRAASCFKKCLLRKRSKSTTCQESITHSQYTQIQTHTDKHLPPTHICVFVCVYISLFSIGSVFISSWLL